MKNVIRISEEHKDVTCENCGWSWNIEPDDKHPYLCHQCGHENTKHETDEGAGPYDAPAFQMKPDHVHFKHQYNEQNDNKGYLLQMGRKSIIVEQYGDEAELFKLASAYYRKNGKVMAIKVLEKILHTLSKRDEAHRAKSQEFPPSLHLQEQKGANEKVRAIQKRLISLGYNLGKTGADGFWGGLTDKAWKSYMSKKGKTTQTQSVSKEESLAQKIVGDKNVLNPDASLLFDGNKLYWMVSGSPTKSWNAISGLTWKNTPFRDYGKLLKRFTQTPDEFSKMKDAGPLPKGDYTIGPIQTRKGNTSEIGAITALWNKALGKYNNVAAKDTSFQSESEFSRIGWGNYRATIIPKPGTVTYGRGDFYIHGGSFEGSHGCIDLTNQMSDFAKYYGTWLASTKKKNIPLLVNYKSDVENGTFTKLWQSVFQPTKEPTRYEKFKTSTPNSFEIGKI